MPHAHRAVRARAASHRAHPDHVRGERAWDRPQGAARRRVPGIGDPAHAPRADPNIAGGNDFGNVSPAAVVIRRMKAALLICVLTASAVAAPKYTRTTRLDPKLAE